jgi:Fic family protein
MRRDIIFAEKGNDTSSRRLRRDEAAGKLTKIHPGIFVTKGEEPVETTVTREWTRIAGYIFPDGVVTDRTGFESMPTRSERFGRSFVFMSAPQSSRTVNLPGLTISQRSGPGPIDGEDIPFMGVTIAGPARRYLDNIKSSRSRSGPSRTLGSKLIEEKLEAYCSAKGEDSLKSLRDDVKRVASKLGDASSKGSCERLDEMIGTLLGSRTAKLATRQGLARASGNPIDTKCLERLQALYAHLIMHPSKEIRDPNTSWAARTNSCFIEAYFSNYIEGTRFLVNEARQIVFDGKIPDARPKDGHDVMKTYLKLMEPPRPRLDQMTPEQFIESLQHDHRDIMEARQDVQPGCFKATANAAGNTVFVQPDSVRGTLLEGFDLIKAASDPLSRSILAHFLVSDVHPFNDGNGRLSRIFMSRELISHGLSHVVVPTAFREDYLSAMRAMTRRSEPDILVRSIMKCQEISAACASEDIEESLNKWAGTHAFLEDGRYVDFRIPDKDQTIEWRDGIPAPEKYWNSIDADSNPTGSVF